MFGRSGELLNVREIFVKIANAPTQCAVLWAVIATHLMRTDLRCEPKKNEFCEITGPLPFLNS